MLLVASNEIPEEQQTRGKLKKRLQLIKDGFEVNIVTVGRIFSDFLKLRLHYLR